MAALDWTAPLREVLDREAPAGVSSLLVVEEPETFVIRSLLQPFAEAVAIERRDARGIVPPSGESVSSRCPVCGDAPRAGVLREEGHGAKKTLQCGRCFTEWGFPRLMCPLCRATRFDALPVFTAETFPHVRIEACDTCHGYLKTIDLTVDGLAVPVVDDLASISLDLWATEHGYSLAPAYGRVTHDE
jgi:FdhE protein